MFGRSGGRRKLPPLANLVFVAVDSANDFQLESLEVLAARLCDFRKTKWKVCATFLWFLESSIMCGKIAPAHSTFLPSTTTIRSGENVVRRPKFNDEKNCLIEIALHC